MSNLRAILLLPAAFALVSCTRDPNVLKRRYLDSGNKYFSNGKFREASLMYRRSLQKDLRFGEAYYRLGLSELRLGRHGEAVRAFRRSIELDPRNTDAHAQLGDFYLAAYTSDPRRPKQALKELQDLANLLLKNDPKSFHGLRFQGYLALLARDHKKAIESFQAADKVKPGSAELNLALAQALTADGQTAEAEQLAKRLIADNKNFFPAYDFLFLDYLRLKRPADAEAIIKAKTDVAPKQVAFLLQLAAFYFTHQRRPEMVAVIQKVVSNPGDFPNGRELAGDFYIRIREFEQATIQYEEGARANPKDKIRYHKKLAEALIYQGKRADALRVIEAVLKDNPKDPESLALRASLSLQTGKPEQIRAALADLQSSVSRLPKNPVLRFDLGRAHLANKELEQARVQFLEAIKLRPDFLAPRIALAQIHLSKGEFGAASQMAGEILQFDPNNLPARLIRSTAMVGTGDKTQARSELNQILKTAPNAKDAQFQLAILDMTDKKFKEAEAGFRALAEGQPPDPRGLLGLVEVQLVQSRFDEAIRLLESELKKAPDRADLRLARANAAARGGRWDVAIAEFQALLKQTPERYDLHLRLGETLRRKGDLEGAVQSFEAARRLVPDDPQPHLQLAILLDQTGRSETAKGVYEQVLKLQPDNPIALNNLAYFLAEKGMDLDQALTLAQRAKQKLPQDPNVSDTLGWIYIKKNLSDSAVSIYQDLTKSYPTHVTWRYHLAMALAQKGDKPRARKELEVALQNKPNKAEEAKIRDLLTRVQ